MSRSVSECLVRVVKREVYSRAVRVKRERLGEQTHDGDVALERGVVERRQPKHVTGAEGCTILDEHLAQADIPSVRRDGKHAHSVAVEEVQRRSQIDQLLYRGVLVALTSEKADEYAGNY